MPQQHNPGRHVQSLTLPQSRHNHRNTSAYIFPTVPTPRTTPPTPGTASPRRRAPTLQLPVATRPLHSRHSPAAAQRFHRSDASEHPADTGPRLAAGHCPASPPGSNAPTPRRNAPAPFKAYPCRRTPAPHRSDASNHPADTGTRPAPSTTSPHRRSPMLQLPVATRPPHSRHTPAAAQRFHRPDASDNPADTGTRHAPGTAPPLRWAPTLQLPVATLPCHSRHSPAAEHRPHIVPTPRPPADTGPRLAAGHCPASPPGRSNSPSQRSRPIQGTHLPPHAGPHRPDASDHPADTRPRLAAGTQRSNSPSQRSRSIQDTPLPPHNGPTPSQPSDHPAGAGFNRTAGHKKIRLCEPDLFICQ